METINNKDEKVEHIGITCDKSGMSPIIGNRYKLIAHNYDLCEEEYNKLDNEEQTLYIKITNNNKYNIKLDPSLQEIYKELGLRLDVREARKILKLDYNIPKADVHKKLISYYLKHENYISYLLENNCEKIFNEIGKEINIPIWNLLSNEEKKNIYLDDRDASATEYYDCVPVIWNDIKLLNFIPHDPYICGYTKGMSSIYTLNLNTLNPTKKSPIQTKLSKELCNKLILIKNKINYKK